MLTRRENLLVRPWQQRRFLSHRRKVKSAIPAIDASAPAKRAHVNLKLKKLQHEEERKDQIEHDNVRLLQRMAAIMRTTRLDNKWITQPPGGFLGRIGIYAPVANSRRGSDETHTIIEPIITVGLGKKSTCKACILKREQAKIPDIESLVLNAEKMPITEIEASEENQYKNKSNKMKKQCRLKVREKNKSTAVYSAQKKLPVISNSVVLTRGQLKVTVRYPTHTSVTLNKIGTKPLVLDREYCSCSMKLPPCTA